MWSDDDIKRIVEYYEYVVSGMPLDDVPMEYLDAVKALIV